MTSRKVALITGAAGHIGSEIARLLAAEGVAVAVVDKNREAGETLAATLGNDSVFMQADLLDEAVFSTLKVQVKEAFGRLDYVVNNAAFYDDMPGWGVDFTEEGYDAWVKVLRVNLLAPFFLVQALHPLLKASASGSVVNIGSIYGVSAPDFSLYEGLGMTNPAAYAASKGGLVQLTKWLSTRLAPEVRVNAVSAGGIERGQNPTFIARYNAKTPLGRMGKEGDIADVVVFLLSEKALYITGQNILVDGGWTVW